VSRPFSGTSFTFLSYYTTPNGHHLVLSPRPPDLLALDIGCYNSMSPVISTDVSEDLAERVEEHQEDGESRSAAIRRLLRAGIRAEQGGDFDPLSYGMVTGGIVVAALGAAGNMGIVWAGIGLLVAGIGATVGRLANHPFFR
jgi:hypothetical protein